MTLFILPVFAILVIIVNKSLIRSGDAKNIFRSNQALDRKLYGSIGIGSPYAEKIFSLRGGKNKKNTKKIEANKNKKNKKKVVEETVIEEEEEEAVDVEENDDFEMNQLESKQIPMLGSIMHLWEKTPPITQIYLLSSIMLTVFSFVFNKNKWPELFHFEWKAILTCQFWRLYTSFLFFGPLDPFYPLTMQFVWQHMSQLEKLNYNKPEEFLMMLLFGGVTLIALYTLLGISMKFLGHNLATYLVYIWSRVFEGMDVNFMDLITLKSEMIPWFFCIQTFLLEREIPIADLIGIVVGHLYHYLREKKKLQAPSIIKNWFSSDEVKLKYAKFKDDFE